MLLWPENEAIGSNKETTNHCQKFHWIDYLKILIHGHGSAFPLISEMLFSINAIDEQAGRSTHPFVHF